MNSALLRELDRLRSAGDPASARAEIVRMFEAVQRDAERYRYLRNRHPDDVLASAGCWIDCETDNETMVLLTGDDADEVIDAAMKGQK